MGSGPTERVTAQTTTAPPNAYGASKLAGEVAAGEAFEASPGAALAIARTAWLYGPPGNDFPMKILRRRARPDRHQPLKVVGDEFGSPTSTADLADAIVELIGSGKVAGMYHLVNGSCASSRADWARDVLGSSRSAFRSRKCRLDLGASSTPPRWGVLESSPMSSG